MKILASLQSGVRNLLGIPGGITPSASLPVAEVPSVMRSSPSLPSAHATSMTPIAAAPVASRPAARPLPPVADLIRANRSPRIGPGETIADYVDKKLAEALGSPLVAKSNASPRAPLAKAKPRSAQPPEPPAASNDTDSLDSAYQQLQEVLQILKSMGASGDDDDGEQEANALFAKGLKAAALKKIMAVTSRLSARTAKKAQWSNMTPHARMALSFDEQPAVAALQAALRPRVAPVATGTPATDPIARIREIDAELAALDREQRKRFSNEAHSRHIALSSEKSACLKRLHAN